jgi:hypothetical protein
MIFYLERSSMALVLLNEFLVSDNVLSGGFLKKGEVVVVGSMRLSLEMGFF